MNSQLSTECSICGTSLVTYLPAVIDTVTGERFAISKCTDCGVGHTVPSPDDIKRYYDSNYYGKRHGFTERYCIRRRMALVSGATREVAGKRLLDVGCGDGSFLREIKAAGWDVAGSEINPNIESTQALEIKDGVEGFSGGATFDCITMWHTLEHMQSVGVTLKQLHELLAPGGRLIIAVPNSGSYQSRIFGRHWLHLDVPRHLYHFDVQSLQKCLEVAGFNVENQKYQELEYDLLGWTQSALNSIFTPPNIFFDFLRGKDRQVGMGARILNVFIGSLLLPLAVPAVLVERICKRSGTIITIASKREGSTS